MTPILCSPNSRFKFQSIDNQIRNQKQDAVFRTHRLFMLLENAGAHLKVRRCIDIAPRRVVVSLQRALERIGLSSRTNTARLLMSWASRLESHQSIAFIAALLPSPYAPRDDEQPSEHNSTTYTDNHTNHCCFGFLGHAARGAAASLAGESRSIGGSHYNIGSRR